MTGYRLDYGTHATPADGRCAMEWVAHLAGEPHSDQPACVSPVLRALCIALNDGLPDGPRQRLRPTLARTIGTAGDGGDPERAWLALDWMIRVYTPAWLAPAGLNPPARSLRALHPVADAAGLAAGLDALGGARDAARGLRTGPPAPWDAVRATARETAWSCAGAAAWAAARLAIGAGAGDEARAAAQALAADAATAVARTAVRRDPPPAGRAALKDAVRAALAPTREALEASALGLLDRMLPLEPLEPLEPLAVPAAPGRLHNICMPTG